MSADTFISWERLDFIGRGGQAKVYKVRTDTGHLLAAKYEDVTTGQLEAANAAASGIHLHHQQQWQAEVQLLCSLRHRNIVQFIAARADPSCQSLVIFTELIQGRTLHRVIDGRAMDEALIRGFSGQLAEALHYLHTRRPPVLHRDINCNNVMVGPNDTVKLIDFGLSISLAYSSSPAGGCSTVNSTASTQVQLGTVGFLAPEILHRPDRQGFAQYSAQSDVWAFGCAVFQMATGHTPYQASQAAHYIFRVVKKGAPPLPRSCSEELRHFYGCCVARDRRQRTAAGDLLQHNFLLYRPEELREMRQLTQEFQKRCAELERQRGQLEQQMMERHRREAAAAESALAVERQRLARAFSGAEKVARRAAEKRAREAAQRAREWRRRQRPKRQQQLAEAAAATAEAADEASREASLLQADLDTARSRHVTDSLEAGLRHADRVEAMKGEQLRDRLDSQLEFDTRLMIVKRSEAIELFDQELARHKRDTEAQRSAQLRAHALERRRRPQQLQAERAVRARQFRESLRVREPGLDGAACGRRAAEFAASEAEQLRVQEGLDRMEARLARESDWLGRQATRTEAALRQELRERLERLSASAEDKRKRQEADGARAAEEIRRAAARERQEASDGARATEEIRRAAAQERQEASDGARAAEEIRRAEDKRELHEASASAYQVGAVNAEGPDDDVDGVSEEDD